MSFGCYEYIDTLPTELSKVFGLYFSSRKEFNKITLLDTFDANRYNFPRTFIEFSELAVQSIFGQRGSCTNHLHQSTLTNAHDIHTLTQLALLYGVETYSTRRGSS